MKEPNPRCTDDVDGTLIQARASQRSFRPEDDNNDPPSGAGRNAEVSFHRQKRSNETHESKTDGDARLVRQGPGKGSKLSYVGHTVMDNRNGLIVKAAASLATGKAEREVATRLLDQLPGSSKKTVGADKNYGTAGFIAGCRAGKITPRVARNDKRPGGSGIDGRTSSHPGYVISQRTCKRVEEPFGWGETIGLIRQMKVCSLAKVNGVVMLTMIGWNLTRMRSVQGQSV